MVKISIIVPIYGVAQYLRQCIDSILKQTYKDYELILVDDGSTDGCYEICEEYRSCDERIRVIHKQNEGLVRARKDGLCMAKGRYVAYVDGDDWIEPTMMERLYNTIVSENVDVVMCGRYEDSDDASHAVYHGIEAGRYDKADMLERVYPRMIANGDFFEWGILPTVWDKLYRKECLEKFQMAVEDSITMGEDAACVYPCLLHANSIYVLHECLYHYRQSFYSMVRSSEKKIMHRENYRLLYRTVLDEFNKELKIYDFREQWKEYVLFLMVVRAGYLYEGIGELDYLFPFPEVKRGSKVLLYGMGTYGQFLYNYLNETAFCEIVAAVDKNYVALRKKGLPVVSPDEMHNYECDAVLVASSYAKVRSDIYQDLIRKFPKEKVHIMDVELVKSDTTMKAFNLL